MSETQETHKRAIRALARAAGIVEEYYDISRGEMRRTGQHTTMLILRAMGLDASSATAALASLDSLRMPWTDAICDAVRVVRGNADFGIHLALPWKCETVQCFVEVIREDGEHLKMEGRLDNSAGRSPRERRLFRLDTGFALPHGYHDVRVRVDYGASDPLEATQKVIVTPWKCVGVAQKLGGRRAFGYWTSLYALRGSRDHGFGNFATLGELITRINAEPDTGCTGRIPLEIIDGETGDVSAGSKPAFLGINPLHTLRNRGDEIGPYSPSSRLFRNVLYIDVEDVPEFSASDEARRLLSEDGARRTIAELRASNVVQHERVLELILPVLRAVHDAFFLRVRNGNSERAKDYARYREDQGTVLDDFATFEAISETMRRTGDPRGACDWRHWPANLRDRTSSAVREFASQNEKEVDFHRFLQFELDRQHGERQNQALAAGMQIGLYGDLALASAGNGFDAWSFRKLFLDSVSVGAPPDAFAADGQSWGCPPLSPVALRNNGYEYPIRLLRAAFSHFGMLRVDHVMGMWRQFWVPEGMSPRDGAYVRYPTDDLLGILALESERANALVVGEDLGNVSPEVRPALRDRGILSSKVLVFEREESGSFSPPEEYEELSLASVNTHDIIPFAGWWLGIDIISRFESQGERDDREMRKAFVIREQEREDLVMALQNRHLIKPDDVASFRSIHYGTPVADGDRINLERLVKVVHQLLCGSASALVSFSLDDIALETEAINRPGVPMSEYRSWTRKASYGSP